MKTTHEPVIVLIYEKEGKIKVLSFNDSKEQNAGLLLEGWNHIATIDACLYIGAHYNEIENQPKPIIYKIGCVKCKTKELITNGYCNVCGSVQKTIFDV